MNCKCGKLTEYNSYYFCYECECGKVYNAVGQELAPIEDWKEDWEDDDY